MSDKTKKVRMLIDYREDGTLYQCGKAYAVSVEQAKAWVDGGIADDNTKAVAFAESQNA